MHAVRFVVALAVIAIGLCSSPALATDARVALPGGGAWVLPAPAGWRQTEQAGPGPTLSLTPQSGNAFQILVSPLVRAGNPMPSTSPEFVRRITQSGADSARAQSVEPSLPLQELRSANVLGSYFSATDKAPKPGEYKYMTQGALAVQGLVVTFTILSNDGAKPAVEAALGMLKDARRE